MKDLEEFKKQELHWYAIKHSNTDNPHIHVVLAGSGENFKNGRREAVMLRVKDYTFLRERGQEHSGYDHLQRDRELAQKIAQEPEHLEPYTRSAARIAERDESRSQGRDR